MVNRALRERVVAPATRSSASCFASSEETSARPTARRQRAGEIISTSLPGVSAIR